jgi:hypothetical protein
VRMFPIPDLAGLGDRLATSPTLTFYWRGHSIIHLECLLEEEENALSRCTTGAVSSIA